MELGVSHRSFCAAAGGRNGLKLTRNDTWFYRNAMETTSNYQRYSSSRGAQARRDETGWSDCQRWVRLRVSLGCAYYCA